MKVLLVQPPIQDFYETSVRLQPIGLCYLQAAIRRAWPGVDVVIKDYHTGLGRKTIPLPRELAYLKEYYPAADKSPFSAFHQYYHFGVSFDRIQQELEEIKPDLVGISSLFTPYYREALEVARRVKQGLDVPVIMGGPHVSEAPESVLAHDCVDFVIRGEGERPIVEFLRYFQNGGRIQDVPNLGYKRGRELCFNPVQENDPIEDLPPPDLSDCALGRYALAGKPVAFMITSRGCPHRCSFCSVHKTFGNRYRRRSLESVLEEIDQRWREGYRVIDFEDDNLTFHKEEFRELCSRLVQRFPSAGLEFTAMNGISYMSLDGDLLERMRRAGFSQLNLSLVSSDRGVRKSVMRPHDMDAYSRVVARAFELGFRIVSYQIFGLPTDSLEGMVQTLAFHARLPVLVGASPFYRTPGAPIAQGLDYTQADYVRARLTGMGVESESFGRGDIYTLFLTTRVINFLKGLDIEENSSLSELLEQEWPDSRVAMGLALLRDLARTGTLCFWTSKGKRPNQKFKAGLYVRLMREAGEIVCQNGRTILVDDYD